MAKPRIALGKLFIRLGKFIESLAVVVMKPDDLVEFSKQSYLGPHSLASWNRTTVVDKGLEAGERALLEKIPLKPGRLLLLGVGTGREAIVFAKKGFEVTGLDFVPEMIEVAKKNAQERGITIEGLIQEMSKLDVPPDSFDVIWMSSYGMYSCIPSKTRRINTLKKIREALKAEGYFVCQFSVLRAGGRFLEAKEFARKLISFLTIGNFNYEKGDSLWLSGEFFHRFPSEEVVKLEFQEAGFDVLFFKSRPGELFSGAVLKKSDSSFSKGKNRR